MNDDAFRCRPEALEKEEFVSDWVGMSATLAGDVISIE